MTSIIQLQRPFKGGADVTLETNTSHAAISAPHESSNKNQ